MKVRIGLETHVQLNTQSKAFCGCKNPVNLPEEPEPNTLVCDTCLGLPGSKPRANQALLEHAIKVALALNCKITKETYFSRKTYFYPDMSKNFQITQYEIPLSESGQVILDQKTKQKVRIKRVHMEEDPSKIVHVGGLGGKYTLLDYNRAGIPLIEIVTEPDFSSPEEARMFLTKLTTILEYLGVYDSTSKAVFKSDANISLAGGKRVEVKNITGTKEIEQALKFEIFRQQNILRRGGKIDQSTRTWDPDTKTTRELRAKETEEDYGYIFEPDLTMIEISHEKIEKMKVSLPELPDEKYVRFIKKYKLEPKIAEALVSELDLANLFEQVASKIKPQLASTWIAGYLKKTLNYNELRFRDSGLKKEWIISLLKMVEKERITDRNAELVIRKMVEDKKDPEAVMSKHRIGKIKKVVTKDISEKIKGIIKSNPKAVQDYKAGENKVLHFLVGLAMKETLGQVDANDIRKLILKLIKK
jgi:aspartyl-tRNA(Asn)/glutamyl-tRNA(Gln) amidotransferase subunit B